MVTLKMGWAGRGSGATLASILASTEGLCGLGGRCALGVGFAPCFWAFLRERTSAPTITMTMGWERVWAEWVVSALVGRGSRRTCRYSYARKRTSAVTVTFKMGLELSLILI